MPVFDDRFSDLLKENRPLLGMFIGFNCPALVEMAGFAGFDFIIIDNEHGPCSIETTENLVRAAWAAGIPPIVRVSGANPKEILRTLDIGAAGIQVPQINTADKARVAVDAAKYPPVGSRGVAFSNRAAGFGFFGGAEHLKASNEKTVVVTHIETAEAVKNLDEMLAVPGIDVMFIGPNDLSVSMGYEGNYNHPDMQKVIADCIRRIAAAGVTPGVLATNPEDFHKYAALGARYMPCVASGLIAGAMKRMVAGCKQ